MRSGYDEANMPCEGCKNGHTLVGRGENAKKVRTPCVLVQGRWLCKPTTKADVERKNYCCPPALVK